MNSFTCSSFRFIEFSSDELGKIMVPKMYFWTWFEFFWEKFCEACFGENENYLRIEQISLTKLSALI